MNTSEACWKSLHIHYNSDPFWLLTEVISPLVRAQRASGAVSQFFFIRYWENGPHIRLRLKTSDDGTGVAPVSKAKSEIKEFLKQRPSVFNFPAKFMPSTFEKLFIEEYGTDKLHQKYGAGGSIPYERNNTVLDAVYEPEYERYGGVHAITLAEQYFEDSSQIVLEVLEGANGHDFRVVLGHALQFFLYACLIFSPSQGAAAFAHAYAARWVGFTTKTGGGAGTDFTRKFDRQRDTIRELLRRCELSLADPTIATGVERASMQALQTIRTGLLKGLAEGRIVRADPTRPVDALLGALLFSFLHMHNNRLGLAISDEIYLSSIVEKAFHEYA